MGIGNDIKAKSKPVVEHATELVESPSFDNEDQKVASIPEAQEIPINTSSSDHKPVYEDLFPTPTLNQNEQTAPLEHTKDIDKKSNEPQALKRFHEYEPARPHKSHLSGILIGLFLLALFGILVWQNLDQIKSFSGIGDTKNDSLPDDQQKLGGVEIISDATGTPDTTAADSDSTSIDTPTSGTVSSDTPASSTPENPSATSNASNLSEIKLQVLNGNGISGSAAQVRDVLIAAGYNVSRLANAAKFSYISTYIYYNTGKKIEAEAVASVLSSRQTALYENPSVAGSYDIVVVVGKQ